MADWLALVLLVVRKQGACTTKMAFHLLCNSRPGQLFVKKICSCLVCGFLVFSLTSEKKMSATTWPELLKVVCLLSFFIVATAFAYGPLSLVTSR